MSLLPKAHEGVPVFIMLSWLSGIIWWLAGLWLSLQTAACLHVPSRQTHLWCEGLMVLLLGKVGLVQWLTCSTGPVLQMLNICLPVYCLQGHHCRHRHESKGRDCTVALLLGKAGAEDHLQPAGCVRDCTPAAHLTFTPRQLGASQPAFSAAHHIS